MGKKRGKFHFLIFGASVEKAFSKKRYKFYWQKFKIVKRGQCVWTIVRTVDAINLSTGVKF